MIDRHPEVMHSIDECKTAGIRTVMITGAMWSLLRLLLMSSELLKRKEAITGSQLANLSDDELLKTFITGYMRASHRLTKYELSGSVPRSCSNDGRRCQRPPA